MAGKRRKARIIALKTLYELDSVGHGPGETLSRLLEEKPAPADVVAFVQELVSGVLEHREEIDAVIRQKAPAWPLEQVAVIDRNILRLAVFELLHRSDIPPKVSINEAIELGKRYSTERSGAFINGILDHIKNSDAVRGTVE